MAVVLACAATVASSAWWSVAGATREQRPADELRNRIDAYMNLRGEAVDAVGGLETFSDPARIIVQRRLLQAEIRRRRADAKQGDVFRPGIRVYIRETLRPIVRGEHGSDIRARLNDDAPDPDAVPLEVNAAYPAGLPFPTTPFPILAALPPLPSVLAYRIIGRDLLLLDQPADLIVDYMRNALPARAAPAV